MPGKACRRSKGIMQNQGTQWLNQYKFTSGKSWREVARDLEVPEQVILSWLSGTNAPAPNQIRTIQQLLGQLQREQTSPPASANAQRGNAPTTPSEGTPPAAANASDPGTAAVRSNAFSRPPDIPCLADNLVERIAGLQLPPNPDAGVPRESIPILPMRTGIDSLDQALGGLPPRTLLHAQDLQQARTAVALWAQAMLQQNDRCGLLLVSALPAREWQRLWSILAVRTAAQTNPNGTTPGGIEDFLRTRSHELERVWIAPSESAEEDCAQLVERLMQSLQTETMVCVQEEPQEGFSEHEIWSTLPGAVRIGLTARTPQRPEDFALIGRVRPVTESGLQRPPLPSAIEWSGEVWLLPPA